MAPHTRRPGFTLDPGSLWGRLFLPTSALVCSGSWPWQLPLLLWGEFAFVPSMASSLPVVSLTFAWRLPHPVGPGGRRSAPSPLLGGPGLSLSCGIWWPGSSALGWGPWRSPSCSLLWATIRWGGTDWPPPSFPPFLRLENAPLPLSLG